MKTIKTEEILSYLNQTEFCVINIILNFDTIKLVLETRV
ncbi:hypothetical protein CBF_0008 [Clostridium botulinum F str. 230613]|uniref:Uncharacterized protein n=1 Tax=Clostridium botulinum (strain Langeland / NCTC 10281 / Type F) TaxID=441772 RepID=A7G9B7_CLOBL|nr:hypothetical protein CLI_0008 [Clostridium botulinum F str. Langeland]ADF97861.1 hypothetical protein CBF_0008 [Clostridium botulinum F str. 230613]